MTPSVPDRAGLPTQAATRAATALQRADPGGLGSRPIPAPSSGRGPEQQQELGNKPAQQEEPGGKPARRPRPRAWSNADMLAEIRRVADLIEAPVVKVMAFTALARMHGRTVSIRFGGWGKALEAAGLAHRYGGMVITQAMRERRARRLTDRQLLAALRRVARRDRVVTVKLLARRASMSVDTFVRRFGSWPEAVRRAGLLQSHLARDRRARDEKSCFIGPPLPPWGTRSISQVMRFRVLKRDDYRCQLCGDSPAITRGTTLEVDHIHPFSQGGQTTEDNLRTLCRHCNQGKGARL